MTTSVVGPNPGAPMTLGPKGVRPTVMVLHGFGDAPGDVADLARAVTPTGGSARLPKLRGSGLVPDDRGWSPAHLAGDVQASSQDLASHAVVGYSYGGSVAAAYALMLGPRRVKALVVLDQAFGAQPDRSEPEPWSQANDVLWHYDYTHQLIATARLGIPTLLVLGRDSHVVHPAETEAWLALKERGLEVVVAPETTGHWLTRSHAPSRSSRTSSLERPTSRRHSDPGRFLQHRRGGGGGPTPSAADTFLDISGSSLAAVRVLARFEQKHGIRIDPKDFFDCKHLGDVAHLLTEPAGAQETDRSAAIAPDGVPAAPAQQWALSSERLDPDAPALQFQVAFRLTGELDLTALEAALADVQHHHDALGTRFVHVDDHDLIERTTAAPSLAIETLPLTDDEPEAPWRARLDHFASTSFPAGGNERWRTLVVRHGPEVSTLCLAFDHRTADGWSLGVILEDLAVCYSSRRRGEKADLGPTSSWLEYAAQERANLRQALERAEEHWRPRLPARFEDYPVEIPGRLDSPSLSRPRTLQRELPTGAARALDRPGRTPFVIATAALARAVSVTNGSDEVRILTSSANRRHAGHERTVGWFATGVFPTYHLDPHSDWEADLDDVSSESRAALSVGDAPAVQVRCLLWPDSPAGFRQDTGIYLACNDGLVVPFQLSGLSADPVDTPDRADSPGLQFFLGRTSTGWTLTCYFREGEYPSEAVEDLILAFVNQLISLPDTTKDEARP